MNKLSQPDFDSLETSGSLRKRKKGDERRDWVEDLC